MKSFIQKLFISVAFVVFPFLVVSINGDFINGMIEFFGLGFNVVLREGKLNNFQIIPVYAIWTFLGLFAYLLYLSLSTVYYEIYNSIILKTAYKKPDQKNETINIKVVKRVGFHFLVILVFLILITLIGALMPLSNLLRFDVEELIYPWFGKEISFWISFLPLIFLWYWLTNGLILIYEKFKDLISRQKIVEEHQAV